MTPAAISFAQMYSQSGAKTTAKVMRNAFIGYLMLLSLLAQGYILAVVASKQAFTNKGFPPS